MLLKSTRDSWSVKCPTGPYLGPPYSVSKNEATAGLYDKDFTPALLCCAVCLYLDATFFPSTNLHSGVIFGLSKYQVMASRWLTGPRYLHFTQIWILLKINKYPSFGSVLSVRETQGNEKYIMSYESWNDPKLCLWHYFKDGFLDCFNTIENFCIFTQSFFTWN